MNTVILDVVPAMPAGRTPRCPTHTAAGVPIVRTVRSLVAAGTPFSFTGQALCCLALDAEEGFKIKRSFNGGRENLWHVYAPSGTLSYCRPDQVVYIEAKA